MNVRGLGLGRCFAFTAVFLWGCSQQPVYDPPAQPGAGSLAVRYALAMVGTPYRYGGNTPTGLDCSGLIQYSYGRAGFKVPRTTGQQRKSSRKVVHTKLRPGDLLFFNQSGKRSSHVGLYIGDNRFVHAPSSGKRVHVSTLTSRYWRRYFAEARRLELER